MESRPTEQASPAVVEQPTIEAVEVSKRFPGVVALDRVSLALMPGEVHALIGENGAGKSTLIKILTGLYTQDEGVVRHHGRPVHFAAPVDAWNAGISTTYQEINLVPQMSVARNLFLGREPRNRLGLLDVKRMNADSVALLSRYGLHLDVRLPVSEYGVGLQQMVAIVRAVSNNASAVILDEPTSSLEPREVDRLFGVIRALREQGVALLYVTHKLDEVFRICDRVTVFRDGRLVHSGPVAEITRIELVARMLGRDIADVQHGLTRFDERHAGQGDLLLEASSLTRSGVIDDVSVAIRPGEVVGLAGLLGSGRSETAKAIFGAQPIDSGTITVAGEPVKAGSPAAAIRAGIALLPEDRKAEGIVPEMSVRENIALAALPRLAGRGGWVSDKRISETVDRFVKTLRIKASSPNQKVSELSGGNQQKVLLARLLCLAPRVLLVDEPSRGIDVGAKAEVQSLIGQFAADGLAVLLISSELEEVIEGSHRVIVLKDGEVVGGLVDDQITESAILSLIAHDGEEQQGGADVD